MTGDGNDLEHAWKGRLSYYYNSVGVLARIGN